MLNVVPSYYAMKFKVKLMKRALENVKKSYLGPDFGLFTSKLEPPKIFLEFFFHELLNIVASYYRMQFKVKLMIEA